ncbi:MAG: hypothetical protein CSB06_02530 [Bacteroidia bacterium]|nr:MAG: hypothetical protein CSB06_02530 [Bacteroidia bacterium]
MQLIVNQTFTPPQKAKQISKQPKPLILAALLLFIVFGSSINLQAQVNENYYITLTVKKGENIKLGFAFDDGDNVKIVNGDEEFYETSEKYSSAIPLPQNIHTYKAKSTTITIYGDIDAFRCNRNYKNITALDISHNKNIKALDCAFNHIKELNLKSNTKLNYLECPGNKISSLDLSKNNYLWYINIAQNPMYLRNIKFGNLDNLVGISVANLIFNSLDLNNFYCKLNTKKEVKVYTVVENHKGKGYKVAMASNGKYFQPPFLWKMYNMYDGKQMYPNGKFACDDGVNESESITLNVQSGEWIHFKMFNTEDWKELDKAIRIKSGSEDTVIMVPAAKWTELAFEAQSSTIKISGTLEKFDCHNNGNKIYGIDASNSSLKELDCSMNKIKSIKVNNELNILKCGYNRSLTSLDISKSNVKNLYCRYCKISSLKLSPSLEQLYCEGNSLTTLDAGVCTNINTISCYNNNFSMETLDKLYCSLPDRSSVSAGKLTIASNTTENYEAAYPALAKSTCRIANNKNWTLYNEKLNKEIVITSGDYDCVSGYPTTPTPNMGSYITLKAKKGMPIFLKIQAEKENTLIKIVGEIERTVTIGKAWSEFTVTPKTNGDIIIYGDVNKLDCQNRFENLTGVDVSNNKSLEYINCSRCEIGSLNFEKNIALKYIDCGETKITKLNVSNNINLRYLKCNNIEISKLEIGKNTKLDTLMCYNTKISSLDISKNTLLTFLDCRFSDNLKDLDITKNQALEELKYGFSPKLGYLDLNSNPNLKKIDCSRAHSNAKEIDKMYCSLPDRRGQEQGIIIPAPSGTDVLYTTPKNATVKNWKVVYEDGYEQATLGEHKCDCNTPVRGIVVTPKTQGIVKGKSEQLTAIVKPADAANQKVIWSSSNKKIATVDANGKVVAIKSGDVIITAKTDDGGFTADCYVYVTDDVVKVSGITVSPKAKSISIDEITMLTATVKPDNATNKKVTWSSSNKKVASVDQNGNVKGLSSGTAIITAKTYDGRWFHHRNF